MIYQIVQSFFTIFFNFLFQTLFKNLVLGITSKEDTEMKPFMDENFLLSTKTAQQLYHDYASNMPIIDYHCHINPEEIASDRKFQTITQVWLGGDHYKWRLMRSNGIKEHYITGSASDREKFRNWAATLQKAIGNPLYHWSHLELQRYFGISETITVEHADELFDRCNEVLLSPKMSARGLIRQSHVEVLCTTDDPVDSLQWHKQLADEKEFDVTVLPAWRPDQAMNLEKSNYLSYLSKLESASGIKIASFADLKEALKQRMAYFNAMGCKTSDHGLNQIYYVPAKEEEIEKLFAKRLAEESLSQTEVLQFKTAFLLFAGREYHRLNWVMQLHYGTKRDNNQRKYRLLGSDTGFDCINTENSSAQLAELLNALDETDELPKTILYSLNPSENAAIDTILGCFQDSGSIGKLQHGSAWWFNDHKAGITDQLTSLANLGLLANFVGMLTDSRSFLSYTRHEYFRRILCDLIGTLVEQGEYPADITFLGKMVQDICYYNCKNYFNF